MRIKNPEANPSCQVCGGWGNVGPKIMGSWQTCYCVQEKIDKRVFNLNDN